jgi:hypothetical protein
MAEIQLRTVRPLQGCDGSNSRAAGSQRALFGAGSCLTSGTTAIGVLPGWIRSNDVPDEGGKLGLGGHPLPEQIIHQHRIRQLQEPGQRGPLLGGRCGKNAACEALEQHVQLLHATTATPQETASLSVECPRARQGLVIHKPMTARAASACQLCRSTSIFLISAIARAGLRSLGHTSVQFMMVWQR